MNVSPSVAAVAGASVVAIAVAFVLRPAALAPPHVSPDATPSPASSAAAAAATPRARTLVYVAGAVVHPGVYAVPADARARDALMEAGGAARDANLVAVNLAAHVADGDEIAVPRIGEAARPPAVRSTRRRTPATGRRRRPAAAAATVAAPLDLNAAGADELAQLPGLGPALAQRIVAFRALNGPFASVDGLADVAGITPQRLDALTPFLRVGRN